MRCHFSILSLGLSLVALPMAMAEAPKLPVKPPVVDAKPTAAKLKSKIFDVGSLLETSIPLPGAAAVGATKAKNAQKCMKLILVMVKPSTWELGGNGGTGKIEFIAESESLCITSSPEVLVEVEHLLEALRKLQDRKVTLDVQIVAVPAGFGTKADWPAANNLQNVPVIVQDAKKVIENLVKEKRVEVKNPFTLTCYDGQSTTMQTNTTAEVPCMSAEYRCTPTISADGKFVELKMNTSIFSPKSLPGNMLYQHRNETALQLPSGHSAITFLGTEIIEEEAVANVLKVSYFGRLFKKNAIKARHVDVYQFVTANVMVPEAAAAPVKVVGASAPAPCCKMLSECGVFEFNFDIIQFAK